MQRSGELLEEVEVWNGEDVLRQIGRDRLQLRPVGLVDAEREDLHLRAQRRLVPVAVPLQREDIEGALDGRRPDIRVAVRHDEDGFLRVGPRPQQDVVCTGEGRERGRVAMRHLALDVGVDASVERALVLAVAVEAGLEVVDVDADRRAERDDGDARVVAVHREVLEKVFDEVQRGDPALARHAARPVEHEHQVDLLRRVVARVEVVDEFLALVQDARLRVVGTARRRRQEEEEEEGDEEGEWRYEEGRHCHDDDG